MLNINELRKRFALGTCSLEYQCHQTAKTFPPGNSFSPPYPFCTDRQRVLGCEFEMRPALQPRGSWQTPPPL